LNDLPFTPSDFAIAATLNGFGFCLQGSRMWKYNPASDEWTEILTLPDDQIYISNFVVDDELYVVADLQIIDTPNVLWKYDKTGTWVKMGSLPVSGAGNPSFLLNGKIYVAVRRGDPDNQLWQYLPGTNSWMQELQYGSPPSLPYSNQVFSMGGKVYIGEYEFDPQY
jgi:hypothetical protein